MITPANYVMHLNLRRLSYAYLFLATIVCVAYLYNFTISSYQFGPKLVGVILILISTAAFYKFFALEKFSECLSWIAILNALFFTGFVVFSYEVDVPKNYFKVGFTYSNFWDFYYQLLLVGEQSYKTISTGYLPLSWVVSAFFAKLDGWNSATPNVTNTTVAYYFLVFSICLSPIFLIIQQTHNKIINTKGFFITLIFVATTYPVLFVFERGNFVLLSFFALCLALYFFHRDQRHLSIFCFAAFFSLKLVNVVLFLTFIRFFGIRSTVYVLGYSLAIQTVSVLYIFDGDLSKVTLFSAAVLAPLQGLLVDAQQTSFIVTDGGRLQGMTSWDNIRVIIRTLLIDMHVNETSVTPVANLIYNLGLVCGLAYFFFKRRKPDNLYIEIIALLSLVFALHSGSAEYNLILLFPPLLLLTSHYSFQKVEDIAKPLLTFLVCFSTIPIILVQVNLGSPLILSGGIRTLSIPLFLTAVFLIAAQKKLDPQVRNYR